MRPTLALMLLISLLPWRNSMALEEFEGEYVFQAKANTGPSAIGMEDWIEKPAGKKGRIIREKDRLLYGGEPIKLWGLNLCYGNTMPEKTLADQRARFYTKYGINTVRLHKFADGPGWAGIQSATSAIKFDPKALDRFDYQVAKFKEAGIYVLLSAHFGTLKLGPDERELVPYFDELGKFDPESKRVTVPHSAVHYAPELQEVQIRQMVELLKHRNPYTGLTYAEDPAVAFVEAINEQSILFYTTGAPLQKSPTLKKQTAERFCDWLRSKYGDQAGLEAAWGKEAINSFQPKENPYPNESLDQNNILPLGNPWFWDPEQLAGSQKFRRQRLVDSALFLYALQCEFYSRYEKAMREAGYEGEVLGSNWQAGRGLSHLLNLFSDAKVGTIDRHNYFGGAGGHKGPFDNGTMLNEPGSGMLSTGLQQVYDRPFMLSEWIHVYPNELGAEGPAIIGAYGMGLQGWDVSYIFQNGDQGNFSERIGRDHWDATSPQVLGIFPAVSRQVLRGDVKESDVQATLYVHLPSVADGSQVVADRTSQSKDEKGFDSDRIPARALAVARCSVGFVGSPRETPEFDVSKYEQDGRLVASTGELAWVGGDSERSGYFTINSPGTRAVVGFAREQRQELGNVAITLKSPFAALYVTAAERSSTIDDASRLLVTAIARSRNTGMKLDAEDKTLLEIGKGPIRLEAVRATIELRGRRIKSVEALDHDGRRTGNLVPVAGGLIQIDGRRDQTPYYEVVLEDGV